MVSCVNRRRLGLTFSFRLLLLRLFSQNLVTEGNYEHRKGIDVCVGLDPVEHVVVSIPFPMRNHHPEAPEVLVGAVFEQPLTENIELLRNY